MDTITLRQGETLELSVTADDLTAITLQLLVADEDDSIVIDVTENFTTVDGKRIATIQTNDTNLPVGDYQYMLKLTYPDDVIEMLPDTASCDDDCSLPVLSICKSLSQEVS
jgi:hypothetical protein